MSMAIPLPYLTFREMLRLNTAGDKYWVLSDLISMARSQNLPFYLVHDAGRTEVNPGTATVLAVGPMQSDIVDKVTGELSLY